MPNALLRSIQSLRLVPQGVRSKLLCGFVLMSVIPLIMLLFVAGWFAFPQVREFYHLEQWFPLITNPTGSTWWLIGIIALTAFISILGSIYLTIKLVQPMIEISHEAKHLAEGDYDRELPTDRDDELGDLTTALNQLTSRIRDNMVELKEFGQRTNEINLEIHKRVIMLSGLLQIGELISNGAELEVVLDLVVEKLGLLDDRTFSFLCLQPLEGLSLTLRRAHQLEVKELSQLVFDSTQAMIDAKNPPKNDMREVWEQFGRPNLLLQPVVLRNRRIGVLGVGNRQADYTWSTEWVDLVGVFVKQTSIAIENEVLLRTTKALAIRDELTGVYNESYIRQRMAEEIKRAVMYQRPCSFVMFAIQDLPDYRRRHGEPEAERALKKIARLIQESVSEIDRVGRFSGNALVVLLPERNKRQALEVSEEIRQRVTFAFADVPDPVDRLSLAAGVAENPLDGVTAEELIEKASATIRQPAIVGHREAAV